MLNVLGGSHVCPRCGTLLAEDAGLDLEALAQDESAAAEFGIVEPTMPPTAGNSRNESRTRLVGEGLPELPDFEPITPPRAEPTRSTSLRWEAANWELNEKLRHVERVTAAGTHRRFDAPAASDERRPHFETPSRTANRPYGEAQPPSFAPPSHSPYEAPHYAPSPYPSPLGPAVPSGPGPQSPANPYESNPHEWNERADREYDDYEDDFEEDYEPRPVRHASTGAETAASLLSWTFLGLAVAAFSGGGFLAGWGAIAARPNLEKLGMPIILAGLLALVVGVLPQLFLRQAEEERRRRAAERNTSHREPQRESRGHRGVRAPHFNRRRSRDYDRSHDE